MVRYVGSRDFPPYLTLVIWRTDTSEQTHQSTGRKPNQGKSRKTKRKRYFLPIQKFYISPHPPPLPLRSVYKTTCQTNGFVYTNQKYDRKIGRECPRKQQGRQLALLSPPKMNDKNGIILPKKTKEQDKTRSQPPFPFLQKFWCVKICASCCCVCCRRWTVVPNPRILPLQTPLNTFS